MALWKRATAVILVMLSALVFATYFGESAYVNATTSYTEFNFKVNAADGTAVITGYNGASTSITIPSEVVKNGITYRVTTIGGGFNLGNAVDVSVENGIEAIEGSAFSGNEQLKSFIMPNSVRTIGAWSFSGCKNLERVNLSSNISALEYGTFSWCQKLKSISLPERLESIGKECFYHCSELSSVDFQKCKSLRTIEGRAFCSTSITRVNIPEGVTTIGDFADAAFSYSPIEKLVIPSTVENDNSFFSGYDGKNPPNYTGNPKVFVNYSKYGYVRVADEAYGLTNSRTASTCKGDFYPIDSPSNLKAEVQGTSASLTWKSVSVAAKYNVYKSLSQKGNYQLISSRQSGTTFTDTSYNGESICYYAVCPVYTDCLGETVEGMFSICVLNSDKEYLDSDDVSVTITDSGKKMQVKAAYPSTDIWYMKTAIIMESDSEHKISYYSFANTNQMNITVDKNGESSWNCYPLCVSKSPQSGYSKATLEVNVYNFDRKMTVDESFPIYVKLDKVLITSKLISKNRILLKNKTKSAPVKKVELTIRDKTYDKFFFASVKLKSYQKTIKYMKKAYNPEQYRLRDLKYKKKAGYQKSYIFVEAVLNGNTRGCMKTKVAYGKWK